MKTTKRSGFEKRSGCYPCGVCKRMTRSTGRGDNENVGLCAECYDMCGIENEMSDHGETPELLAELESIKAVIISKGGVLKAA
jgi:hypothetical protein